MADQWEYDIWGKQLGSKITGELASADWSASYEMDAAHLLKLENGKFVVVLERGCSCYSSDDADLNTFDNETAAREYYNQHLKENNQ